MAEVRTKPKFSKKKDGKQGIQQVREISILRT
jgi:hypothetical protein